MTNYDVIVLGTGGVGSAAAFHAARRGAKVLGIDRFPGGHDRGSSHGETRIIRQAYFEHSSYVPLLLRAYELWRELEQESRTDLLHQVGLVQIGPPEGAVVRGVLESAKLHGLTVQQFTGDETEKHFPAFKVPPGFVGVFEPAAGYLKVERCVLAHLAAAERYGATFRFGSGVATISFGQRKEGPVEIRTHDHQTFAAEKLVVAPGAWAPGLLVHLDVKLEVRRKHLYWFEADDPVHHERSGCPTFLYDLPEGVFYGFPQIDEQGVKVAEHSGGAVVTDPLNDPRALDDADLKRVTAFFKQYLPGLTGDLRRRSVCFYTMTPDEHFLVDRHPHFPRLLFAAGLSGHGFKFTSVLGEVLADLALEGKTKLPIGFLGVERFSRNSV